MRSRLLFGLFGWLLPALLWAGGVNVTHVALEERGDMLYLHADAHIELFDTQREALESGVPLTFAWEFVIEQERDWLWPREVMHKTLHARIEYHSLARIYRLVWLEGEDSASFTGLAATLEALGRLRDVPLGPVQAFPQRGSYRGRARLGLELGTLPLPIRPRAYFSERWDLASVWYLWAF